MASLAGVERGARLLSAVLGSPTGTARWIWSDVEAWSKADPIAFDVVCDFEVAAAPPEAILAVQGDEEFIVWLNGRAVGSGRFGPGDPLHAFDVHALLQPGGNRLLARVRSSRGAGGFLASVRGGGQQFLASGADCRILQPAPVGVIQGWLGLPADGLPKVWGLPPTGRWGEPVLGTIEQPVALAPPRMPIAATSRRVAPAVSAEDNAGEFTLFEWPRVVSGVLRLRLVPKPGASALLFLSADPPDVRSHRGVRVLVTADADREWTDVTPQRFRYALVAGLSGVRFAEVLSQEAPVVSTSPPVGVFGLRPPPLRSPVEDEIRYRLGDLDHLDFAPPRSGASDDAQAPPE